MTAKTRASHALIPAALAFAALCPGLARAAELTDLPGVIASANACYLNPGCDPAGVWSAANVIDGVLHEPSGHHSWNAGNYGSLGAPQWVRLDFGSTYRLEGVDLSFIFNGAQYANYTNLYELRTSVNGIAWDVAAAGTLVDSTDFSLRNDTWTWASGAGPLARYVEYRVVGGTHWATLGEMNVQGVAAVVPEPATAAMLLAGLAAVGLMGRRAHRG